MAFFDWEDSYSVGVEVIDRQHRRLIELISQLHEAVERNRREQSLDTVLGELTAMASVLDELVQYTVYHFTTEEGLMWEQGYPASAAHKQAHEEFVRRIQSVNEGVAAGTDVSPARLIDYLKDWLRDHILRTDKVLGAFLQQHTPV